VKFYFFSVRLSSKLKLTIENLLFSTRYLFAVTPALCVLQLTISPFLLESPRWLLGKDEKSAEARVVIKQMRGFRHDGDVEHEVQHFLFAASKHKTPRESAHSGGAMYDLLQATVI
jgi:hypothetical protein